MFLIILLFFSAHAIDKDKCTNGSNGCLTNTEKIIGIVILCVLIFIFILLIVFNGFFRKGVLIFLIMSITMLDFLIYLTLIISIHFRGYLSMIRMQFPI